MLAQKFFHAFFLFGVGRFFQLWNYVWHNPSKNYRPIGRKSLVFIPYSKPNTKKIRKLKQIQNKKKLHRSLNHAAVCRFSRNMRVECVIIHQSSHSYHLEINLFHQSVCLARIFMTYCLCIDYTRFQWREPIIPCSIASTFKRTNDNDSNGTHKKTATINKLRVNMGRLVNNHFRFQVNCAAVFSMR